MIPAVARAAMDVRPLGPADHQAYDRFVAASPGNTVYHARAWHELLRRCFGYEPRVLVAWQDGAIVGTLPLALVDTLTGGRRLVSLPFSHHVAPLLRSADVAPGLLAATSRLATESGCRFVELRAGDGLPCGDEWRRDESYVTTVLGLERDAEAQMRRLRPATRQQLAQGLRNPGLVVDDRLDEPALRQFAALIASTRRRKGSLTYPWRFYSELRTAFVEPGFARIERAFLRGQCIAALLTFRVGRTAIYGYGAATGDQAALRARPMNVLMWRAIGWAREQGADVFDFGSSPASQEGLIHFKEGWGSVTEPLPYYVWDRGGGSGRSITQDGLAARLAARVLRHMPEPLFSRLTPYLLRQVG